MNNQPDSSKPKKSKFIWLKVIVGLVFVVLIGVCWFLTSACEGLDLEECKENLQTECKVLDPSDCKKQSFRCKLKESPPNCQAGELCIQVYSLRCTPRPWTEMLLNRRDHELIFDRNF